VTIAKVLIVDDEEDIRFISQIAARDLGQWEVILAGSGEEALALAERERPDVILLDVMMPGMDGIATLAKLRADPATAEIPVIFLTAKVQKPELEHYRDLGAVGTICKPFDVMELPNEVRRIVEGA
jgi:CheY-like chemotaxis protein